MTARNRGRVCARRATRVSDARSIKRAFLAALRPPPNVTVSEWADRFRFLTSSQAANPGRWRTSKVEYLRDIMDALSPLRPEQRIVVMKSRRGGFTEGVINNTVGAFMHMAPCPILVTQPTESDGEEWSKDSLDPMLETSPVLRGLVSPDAARRKGNTITHKRYRGGVLYARPATTSRAFRRILARLVLCDEIDAYPLDVDGQGHPGKQAEGRADTFTHSKKVVHGSTPTVMGQSAIEAEYLGSTMGHYHVPCPECRHMQELVWEQVVWIGDDPKTAEYACIECGSCIPHRKKRWMLARENGAHWVHEHPGRTTLGFHFSAIYSPWVTWAQLAEEWLQAQGDPTKEQVFVNQSLGKTWDLANSEKWNEEGFRALLERMPWVPARASVLTAGVDVQHDRLVLQVDAWGAGEERWTLGRWDLLGDPSAPEVWRDLAMRLRLRYPVEGGGSVRIRATCVDTGDRYTQAAWDFCRAHQAWNVWGIKGGTGTEGKRIWPREKRFRNKGGYSPIIVGVSAAKEIIHARLRRSMDRALAEQEKPAAQRAVLGGKTFWHFSHTLTESYFEELTAEVQVNEYSKAKRAGAGPVKRKWILRESGRRNEALDVCVYSYAALCGLLAADAVMLDRPLKPSGSPSDVETIHGADQGIPSKREESPKRETIVRRRPLPAREIPETGDGSKRAPSQREESPKRETIESTKPALVSAPKARARRQRPLAEAYVPPG